MLGTLCTVVNGCVDKSAVNRKTVCGVATNDGPGWGTKLLAVVNVCR